MASEEHRQLSEYIKNVHQSLRVSARKIGASQAWKDHCQQKEMLKKYAKAMHQLATEHWDNNSEKIVNCRIQWIAEQSVRYFIEGGQDIEKCKEMKRIENSKDQFLHIESCANCNTTTMNSELLLLDVGSCYNPFKKYPFFKVLPFDLNPACSDVFEADFLSLSVTSHGMTTEDITKVLPVRCIPEKHFDIVVFSLLLEYMPSCQQRFVCCEKAYHILKPEGILFIISPDSKHASANASLMRKWRICLAQMGFTRIVYEKLPHIHCMVFRKNCHAYVSQQWAQRALAQGMKLSTEPHNLANMYELLKIPQDYTEYLSPDILEQTVRTDEDNSLVVDMFQELPQDLEF